MFVTRARWSIYAVLTAATACLTASAATSPARPCPPVAPDLCERLQAQVRDGRRQVEGRKGTLKLELPVLNSGLAGQGEVLFQNQTMLSDRLDKLDIAVSSCMGATYTPDAMTIEGFWRGFGAALDREAGYVCDGTSAAKLMASAPTSRPSAGSGLEHLLLDLDLGVPTGVRVGYEFDGGHGVGVRAAGGPALFSSSIYPAGIFGVFGALGVAADGAVRVEATAGAVLVSSSVGWIAGAGVHLQSNVPKDDMAGTPTLGLRLGVAGGAATGSPVFMPDASIVLAW